MTANQHSLQAIDAGEHAATARVPWRGYALAVLALLASLLVVFGYWRGAVEREQRAAEIQFHAETGEFSDLLRQRLRNYELITRGGVSLFASVAQPSGDQWKEYVDGFDTSTQFPGLIGIGYAPSLDASQLAALQAVRRVDGTPLLSMRPQGVRDRYGPVLYLEPTNAANAPALGFDMLSEPARGKAMRDARDSAETRLTAPLQLVLQNSSPTGGIVLYTPAYGARAPETMAARAAALRGWVYVPLRVSDFVTSVDVGRPRTARVRIADVTDGQSLLLYADRGSNVASGDFTGDRILTLYGRRWQLSFNAPTTSYAAVRGSELATTLAVGLFASLLIFGIALTLARTESIARRRTAQMTASYRHSERRLRNAMHYSTVGTALLGRDDLIVEANPALASMLGIAETALVGQRLSALFVDAPPDADTGRVADDPREVRRVTRDVIGVEGQRRQLQLVYSPIGDRSGDDVSTLVQAEDITERRRSEARERAANRTLEARVALRTRELTHTNRELESFAYSVSHDLRSPLRAIDGFTRVLQERHSAAIGDEGRDYLGRVRKAAARMDALIEALLRVSRVSRGTLTIVPLELDAIAAEIVDELRRASPERHVHVSIEPGLDAMGDATLIRTLLENLIGNAWKFTGAREQAHIAIAASRRDDEHIECVVRDDGAGFEAEYADKLFRPFQRLHGQNEFAGHGIGLASVKRILERHGGTIRAEGAKDAGAAFYFTLPRSAPHD